jgi:hypothetical protein
MAGEARKYGLDEVVIGKAMIRTFLFWNLNKKPLEHLITQLAEQYKVDVLIFAESTIPPSTLLSALNVQETIYHYAPSRECKKIDVYSRFSDSLIRPVLEGDRTTIRRLAFPDTPEIGGYRWTE